MGSIPDTSITIIALWVSQRIILIYTEKEQSVILADGIKPTTYLHQLSVSQKNNGYLLDSLFHQRIYFTFNLEGHEMK